MSGNNQRPLDKSPLADAIFENIKANQDMYRASIEQGRIIGRREMKPLISELLHLLDVHSPEWDRGLADVFKRAKEALEND